MNTTLNIKSIPQSVKSAVDAYMLARTMAESEREKVDAIKRNILETADYWPCDEWSERGIERKPIRDPKHAYLMDEKEWQSYSSDVRYALEMAGYDIKQTEKTDPYWSYLCPALCAESVQHDAERLLIRLGAEMLGVEKPGDFNNMLLCCFKDGKTGLQHRAEFIDLICKVVVNLPDYKNPLTGKAA